MRHYDALCTLINMWLSPYILTLVTIEKLESYNYDYNSTVIDLSIILFQKIVLENRNLLLQVSYKIEVYY